MTKVLKWQNSKNSSRHAVKKRVLTVRSRGRTGENKGERRRTKKNGKKNTRD